MNDKHYLLRSIQIAQENVARGGQPFGAVLMRDGQVLAEGVNETYAKAPAKIKTSPT